MKSASQRSGPRDRIELWRRRENLLGKRTCHHVCMNICMYVCNLNKLWGWMDEATRKRWKVEGTRKKTRSLCFIMDNQPSEVRKAGSWKQFQIVIIIIIRIDKDWCAHTQISLTCFHKNCTIITHHKYLNWQCSRNHQGIGFFWRWPSNK